MATLRWDAVNVFVDVPNGACRKPMNKQIIFRSSGIIRPGQILAVVGPSGAGKTTLFNVLAKRNADYDVTGSLFLNGRPYDGDLLKIISGFVWQDPLYHSHLTPREALHFAARLKDPMSVEQRTERVNNLLHAFDLERCSDTRIGNDTIKGISGGEKKRLSIAVEVISNPKLLFLDEPTSGLDSTSAYRVVSLLRFLADAGTTVIMTIHQPRPAIAKAIDRFLVLSAGWQVFFGPVDEMMQHFSDLGFACPPGENPLDHILDLINNESDGSGFAAVAARMLQIEPRKNSLFKLEPLPSAVAEGQSRTELAMELSDKFTASKSGFLDSIPEDAHQEDLAAGTHVRRFSTFRSTWFARIAVVIHREFLQKWRNPQVGLTQLSAAIVMGTIMGSFYYQIPSTSYILVSNALAFVFMFTVFFSFHLVLFFPRERHIHTREFTQGIMGSSEYYFGMVLTDLPGTTLAAICFSTIFYFMVGLRPEAFGTFLGIVVLAAVTGGAMLLCVGAFAPDPATANSLVSMVFLFCMFLNGYFAQSPPAWTWIEAVNYLRFVTMASFVNQWANVPLNCTSVPDCTYTNGNQVLQQFRVPTGVSVATWCGYTLILFGVFHIVGLCAVSFLYNGRVQNWWKRRKEQRRLQNNEPAHVDGNNKNITTKSFSLPGKGEGDFDDPLEVVDL